MHSVQPVAVAEVSAELRRGAVAIAIADTEPESNTVADGVTVVAPDIVSPRDIASTHPVTDARTTADADAHLHAVPDADAAVHPRGDAHASAGLLVSGLSKEGLAGFVHSARPLIVRVPVAIVTLPFWLTSEIRQSGWHIAAKWASGVALWLTVLIVGTAPFAPPPNTGQRARPMSFPSVLPHATATLTPATPTPTPLLEAPKVIGAPPTGVAASTTALSELSALPVREERREGYDRDLFHIWLDVDHDGCDTRREVLMQESLTAVTEGSGCSLSGGTWYSAYDGVTTTDASSFDIDHFVPLAEAWDSGAYAWSSQRRDDFANDLGYTGSLMAVTASSNRSKSDGDPAEWEPPLNSYWCPYDENWVAVKTRWSLAVDPAEVRALQNVLDGCGSAGQRQAPMSTVAPAIATPAPTVQPSEGGDCAPSYPDFCIPPPPPDLDCGDVSQKRFTVRWDVPDPDPHGFDHDRDGIGCES